ncbi:MAG: trigger factor [Bacteroidetes bacterium]|nr:trigger factor [Bacteroidota bacterium]
MSKRQIFDLSSVSSVNVKFEEKDALNALLTIEFAPEDYQPKVESELKKYRKNARIPGFRPGTAPMAMVKKLVGKAMLVEEINRMASDTLYQYLTENKIDVLGQPLAAKDKEAEMDFDNPTDFTFYFDLGLAPKFELNISDKDVLTRYRITITDKDIDEEIENNRRRSGKMTDIEETGSDQDSVKGMLTELDANGEPLEGGVAEKESTVLLEMIKDDELRNSMMNKKVGDSVVVDVFKFFNDNNKVLGRTLEMPEEGLSDLNREFRFTITELKRFEPAEINQELYDQMFGKDAVTTEEEFRQKIRENLETYYASEAENQLDHSISHLIQDKHTFELPDEFLKRWLIKSYEDQYNDENVDDRYETESSALKNQLITEKVIEQYQLQVTEEDLNQVSLGYTAQMLRQYGLGNPDLETLRYFEQKNREEQNYMKRIRDIAVDRKVTEKIKELITIQESEISIEDFYKMIEEHNHVHNHQ